MMNKRRELTREVEQTKSALATQVRLIKLSLRDCAQSSMSKKKGNI